MDPRARQALKIIGKILLGVLRATVLLILVIAWIAGALPSGKGRSQCALARALRSYSKNMIKKLLPRSVAAYVR